MSYNHLTSLLFAGALHAGLPARRANRMPLDQTRKVASTRLLGIWGCPIYGTRLRILFPHAEQAGQGDALSSLPAKAAPRTRWHRICVATARVERNKDTCLCSSVSRQIPARRQVK